MGYRGEDVSATQGTWGRETPWHSSSDDPAADGAGHGYRADAGYPDQGQPEYGQQDGQYAPSHGQQQSYDAPRGQSQPGQYDYEPGDGTNGYGQPGGYAQHQDYGYSQGSPVPGYGQDGYQPAGYDQGSYDQGSYGQGGYEQPAGGYGADAGQYQPQGGGTNAGPGAGYPGGSYQGDGGGYQGQPERGYPGAGDGGYQGAAPGYPDSSGYPGAAGYPDASRYSDPAGYSSPAGYRQSGGYQSPRPASGGYPALPRGGGYQAQDGPGGWAAANGSGSHPAQQGSGSYPAQAGGYAAQQGSGSYPAQSGAYPTPNGSGSYPSQNGSGSYPTTNGSGSYPSQNGSGSYPAQDAGNDWYGGQPAAANGASFADTGSYRLNGRVPDEYGTGPRALGDPSAGYPAAGPLAADQLPTSVIPAVPGPLTATRNGAQQAPPTGPQTAQRSGTDAYPGTAAYPRYGRDDAGGRANGYGGTAVDDDAYGDSAPGSFGATGYDDYGPGRTAGGANGYGANGYGASEYGTSEYGAGEYPGFDQAGDTYQDQYGDGPATRTAGGGRGAGRGSRGGGTGLGPLRGKRLLLAALTVIAVGIIGVAVYVFAFKHTPAATNPNAAGPLPTGSAAPSTQACQKLGTYCHIETRALDPTPLTTAGLFPPAFTNETDKISYSLVSSKTDKTCKTAVIGSSLVSALSAGHCNQVLRASYVSGDGKIMGTIGVVNLSTTNEAHDAGKVVGQSDFIAPLTAAKGVASKLGNGTGVVEAEFKGHYLILTWSEYVNGTTPKTTAQDNQLEQFGNDLVAGTANVTLSQRMVNGASPSASPSASAKASS